MARAVYSLLAYCALAPVFAYLWWRGRKDAGYRLRWSERLAWHTPQVPAALQDGVIVHCASVGEVIAARPLVERLRAEPGWGALVLTCSTPTGSRLIAAIYGGGVGHAYFPLDLPGATRRFLRAWRPRLVVLMERELWPNFLHEAQALGVPVALVNARLSERSAASTARWPRLMQPALATLRLVCAEDTTAAGRFAALGIRPERLVVTGNIKSDIQRTPELLQKIAARRQALGRRPVLTAGSTHPGEDEALVEAFARHLERFPRTLLVLVPRHPERFEPVARLLDQAGLRCARLGLGQLPQPETQVLLGDTLGELLLWYGVADAAFVGGSLIPRGGHNPLEVLCQAVPLIAGPHTANFEPLYSDIHAEGGMLRVADAAGVFQQFRMLLQDPSTASDLAQRGHAAYERLAGATARTLEQLKTLAAFDAAPAPLRVRDGQQWVWADGRHFDGRQALELFDPSWWNRDDRTASQYGAGRGNIHAVADGRRAYLLRHYYRGGLMARISRDLFLAQPVGRSRAMQEFALLQLLRARGLPVPQACAARYRQCGAWYRADILVERIPDATDVARLMHGGRALSVLEWTTLGAAIRRLHDAQVFHSDLNCHNLMLDTRGAAWIVDFDKCRIRTGEAWKQDNLDRLLRSLRKELRRNPAFRWKEEADWACLLDGYQPDIAPPVT